jgi:hypothetical protein
MAAAFKHSRCLGVRRRYDMPCVSSPAGIALRCFPLQKRASFSEFTLDFGDGFVLDSRQPSGMRKAFSKQRQHPVYPMNPSSERTNAST